MHKTIRKILVVLLVIILVALAYGFGSYASALKWNESAVSDAWARYAQVSKNKQNELSADLDEIIEQTLLPKIESILTTDEVEIAQTLEDYFYSKVNELEDSPDFVSMKDQIQAAKIATIEAYKREIDKLFSSEDN